MRPARQLTTLVLGASALLVAALVGVLYVQLRSPVDPEPADVSPLGRRTAEPRPAPELPGDGARGVPHGPTAVPQEIRTTPPERLGAEIIVGRVVDAVTGEAVTDFHVDVLASAPGSPLERLLAAPGGGTRSRPFHVPGGVFRIERARGTWDLVVRAPGYLPAEVSGVAVPLEDRQPLAVRLDPGPTLSGLVYDVGGQPVPDVPVFLHVSRLDDPRGDPPARTVTNTGWDGRFRFTALPSGMYAVALLEPDNPVDRQGGILVQGGRVDVRIPLEPRHHVVVCVRDAQGRPVRDAQVELRAEHGGEGYASGATLPSGQVTLRHLLGGDYVLRVAREGYEDAELALALDGASGDRVQWVTLRAR